MQTRPLVILAGVVLLAAGARAQGILFDFDNAPLQSPLPITLTAGGVTARFSATGQGYSIQSTSTAQVVPVGFTGRFIYPSSVYAADLLVDFSQPLTNFSILYSPQELGCDDSARMRVTAYMDTNLVGTATATAPSPGTWPAGTLSFGSAQGFNKVVMHYDARPPTCQDYGPIFLADNMMVTPAPAPPARPYFTSIVQVATDLVIRGTNGVPARAYHVLGTTNVTLPQANWERLLTNLFDEAGGFVFTNVPALNSPQRFYLLQLP